MGRFSTGGGGENSSKMNKGLCVLLVVCLVVSLIIPDIDAANIKKHRGRVSATRSRSQIRRSKAKAIRQNRSRQSARRQGRWEEEPINEPLEEAGSETVVEEEGGMDVPGLDPSSICEAVIFTKDAEVIDFKFIKNDC